MLQRHRLLPALALATLLLALPEPSAAQPKGETAPAKRLTIKKLPPGTTDAQLRQRLETLAAARRAQAAADEKAAEATRQKLIATMSAEQAKIEAVLKKDARYQSLVAEAQKISTSKASSADKLTRLRSLAKQNKQLFATAFTQAGVDRAALQSKLAAAVPGTIVTADLGVRNRRTLATGGATSSGTATLTPRAQEVVLRPPFSFEEGDTDNGGIGATEADTDLDADHGEGESRVSVIAVAGGGEATTDVGEVFQIPAGVKRIDIVVAAKIRYDVSALGVIGTGAVSTHSQIRAGNTNDGSSAQNGIHAIYETVIAPVAWYAEGAENESKNYSFSFTVPENKREYSVSGQTRVHAIAAGPPGYAGGTAKTEIDKITVTYHYE